MTEADLVTTTWGDNGYRQSILTELGEKILEMSEVDPKYNWSRLINIKIAYFNRYKIKIQTCINPINANIVYRFYIEDFDFLWNLKQKIKMVLNKIKQ